MTSSNLLATDSRNTVRNTLTLSAMQSLGGTNPAIIVALGGLVGQQLASRPELSTLPISLFNLGVALGTIPAALLMRHLGRKGGYLLGASTGISAGLIAAWGIYTESFLLFCIATVFAGLYASYVLSYRFAAVDNTPSAFQARAISWVMAGGLLAAVIATQTIMFTQNIWPGTPYLASFLAHALLALLAIPLILLLRSPAKKTAAKIKYSGRSLKEICLTPRFVIAVLTGIVSYGLMTLVMTATPLAMQGCGHSLSDSTLGIQWHILAMYGPSFFTGNLIQRLGKIPVTMTGILLIAVASVIALSGLTVAHFWLALILLGIGWNFSFIGATAMVTQCYRPEEKNRVQALNDFLVFGCVAAASFLSGQMLAAGGWDKLNMLVFPTVGVVVIALIWLAFYNKRNPELQATTAT